MDIECKFCAQVITKKDVLYETDNFLILDANTNMAPTHYILITRNHISQKKLLSIDMSEINKILNLLLPNGYRIIMNYGPCSGQLEDHFHIHIFSGMLMRSLGI